MELKRRDFLNLAAALAATALIEGPVTTFAASKEDKVANAARSYVGSRNYYELCLQLCGDAYAKAGYPFKRYGSAIQAYNAMRRKVQRSDKKGALMFWDARPTRPNGHVAIYIGDGRVVTSWTAWSTLVDRSLDATQWVLRYASVVPSILPLHVQ